VHVSRYGACGAQIMICREGQMTPALPGKAGFATPLEVRT
jgi:hypothetical protein